MEFEELEPQTEYSKALQKVCVEQAAAVLKPLIWERLAQGEASRQDLIALAKAAGYGESTCEKIVRDMEIRGYRRGGPKYYALPKDEA